MFQKKKHFSIENKIENKNVSITILLFIYYIQHVVYPFYYYYYRNLLAQQNNEDESYNMEPQKILSLHSFTTMNNRNLNLGLFHERMNQCQENECTETNPESII